MSFFLIDYKNCNLIKEILILIKIIEGIYTILLNISNNGKISLLIMSYTLK